MTNWLSGDRLRGMLFGTMIAWVCSANAEVVPDLYAVSVPVSEQSSAELERAAAIGLREVAVRISGRSGAANESAFSASFASAIRYLEQYRYERNSGSDSPWLAQLRFASALVDSELRKSGLPIWGINRPSLLTIVAVDDKGARTIVDDQSPLASALREQWRRRGLSLHLPRNAGALNIDNVMRLESANIAATAQEHNDGLVLGAIAIKNGGGCESRWSLTLAEQVFNTQASGSLANACVASAIDRIVDNFSAQYAIAANSGAEGIVLRVTGVASFEDYTTLLNYLRRLAVIKSAQPLLVHGDEIQLQLKIAGNADQLVRQLALESRLTPTASNIDTQSPTALNYRWAVTQN